jgi:hypothetical protein
MSEENTNKKSLRVHQVIIGVLSLIIVVLLWQLIVTKTRVNTFIVEKEKAVGERQGLQHQLDSLITIHDKIKKEYGTMSTALIAKDSMIQAQATEIQKLIVSNAGKNQIQKKLDYLRGITQDYVAQIDKLLKENKELKTEIAGMEDNIKDEKQKSAALTKDKEDLKEQITKAAVLAAYSIKAEAIKFRGKKEEVTDRAKKAEKIKITFTLAKNSLVAEGLKEVYIRIAKPDNQILNDGGEFDFDGKAIMYSLKTTVNYQSKPIDISLYYEKTDRIVAGTYHFAIFTGGQEIGQTQLTLK